MNINILADEKLRDCTVSAAASLIGGVYGGDDDLEGALQMAALEAGMPTDDFRELLANSDFQLLVRAEQVKRQMSGAEARCKAKVRLSLVLDRITERAATHDLPVTTLIKVGEFLHRVSGVDAEYAQELRKNDGALKVGFFVVSEGEPEPDTSGMDHCWVIRLGTHHQPKAASGETIEGEARHD